ncbi:MAG: BatA domain-containing protein, partial [Proteobacteria bacterium]|nr:BatA domain-containing protein [Pseudomonadota bacterium]
MLILGSLAFAAPWMLTALAALPALIWLMRVTPPAPQRIRFPAIRLLFGLHSDEQSAARTPLWLLILRALVAALVIVALARPILNPDTTLVGDGPVLLVVD